jgi:hypothetical protein
MENRQLKEQVEKLSKGPESEFLTQIFQNLKELLGDFHQNSPFRRPLLSYLCQNINKKEFKKQLNLSEPTWQRIKSLNGGQLTSIEYTVGTTRERISEDQRDEIKRILNDILPVQSGRDYRYQEETDDQIYQNYVDQVKKGVPVSKTFFVYTILAHELIHHSKKPKFCKICDKYEECVSRGEEIPLNLLKHKDLILLQRGAYASQKKEIAGGDTTTVLITQDFTQIEFDGGFVQDLIICCYSHDSNAQDGLKRSYQHFVGDINDSNQIPFVAGSWIKMFEIVDWFENIEKVQIWSDGGPKHFKISSNMATLKAIQDEYDNIDWIYNFFESYHGCNICDAVGAQAKRAVNDFMRNNHKAIRNQQRVIDAINQLKNHRATSARLLKDMNFSVATLQTIKSYYCFMARPRNPNIYAFKDSTEENYDQKWKLPRIFNLKEMKNM